VGFFDAETSITRVDGGVWETHLSANWNIGTNSNGGYAMAAVLRALRELTGRPDPISVTTHYLRPVRGGDAGRIEATLIRTGRTTATARGTLSQDGRERLLVMAAFGELEAKVGIGPEMGPAPPELPAVEDCVSRGKLNQDVELPLLSRVDCVLHPGCVKPGDRAVVEGWIRFCDGADPTTLSLPCFVDMFPPSLTALVGSTGWVPTIELTIHIRRTPKPGWLRARFECDDLHNGRMIETGALWDSSGAIVARSRQIGLLLKNPIAQEASSDGAQGTDRGR
jgi:acyl-CoA thioesterase